MGMWRGEFGIKVVLRKEKGARNRIGVWKFVKKN